ncbi:hypothetical protein PSHT_01296 [Puccinia striiformis]|uniref:SprT-like domain-containing protein n=1 Tax=Puccinia striiformis TaxID=27350 RepID=A0A2S4WL45_9BASI|nr:hypothetical protein PSHT_01296 [Puccinia striiformis]
MTSTAGKFMWQRVKGQDGNDIGGVILIRLSAPILNNLYRLRKTLAHEMCHAACSFIDQDQMEYHGPLFKGWAGRVGLAFSDFSHTLHTRTPTVGGVTLTLPMYA